jgi:hypothetical protein
MLFDTNYFTHFSKRNLITFNMNVLFTVQPTLIDLIKQTEAK